MNDGVKNGNLYCEKPQTLVKDLFLRQEKHVIKWNQQIYNESNDLLLLRADINKDSEYNLFHASEILCLTSFREFKDRMDRSSEYSKQTVSPTQVIIRSLKHPSAPPRQCHRVTIVDDFKCCSCESSIAREEQCVHSIVANEKRFIPEQFATYHFQRKYISGSYISFNPTECDDNNEPMSDDDSENERDTCLIADKDFSEQTKAAAHYEQLPSEKENIKCLSESDLKKVMDQILSGYSTCGVNTKKKVNAILLSLNEICSTDGVHSGIFASDMSTVTEIDKAVDEIIQEHKLSFLPARNNFLVTNKNDMSYLRPSLNQMCRQKKARIMSNRHRIIKHTKKYKSNFQKLDTLIHINSTKIPACKFFGSTEQGERISSCKKDLFLKV